MNNKSKRCNFQADHTKIAEEPDATSQAYAELTSRQWTEGRNLQEMDEYLIFRI